MNRSSDPPKQAVVKAIAKKAVRQILKTDTSKLNTRFLNQRVLKKLLDDPAYHYDEGGSETLSFWDRFWRWFWHLFDGTPRHSATSTPYLQYFFAFVVIVGVLYIFIKLMGVNLSNIFSGKPAAIALGYGTVAENIHEINFDDAIKNAIASGNYRLAVRLHYLRILKELNDAQLIKWTLEKTNSVYINELADAEQRRQFAMITRQFEYVWYGGFTIDGSIFKNIHNLFDSFKIKLP